MTSQPPWSVIVHRIAERSFGADWPQHVAALTQVNLRTLQRVRQAAREGVDHPFAIGALRALSEAVETLKADLDFAPKP